jgi:hypothetical protein
VQAAKEHGLPAEFAGRAGELSLAASPSDDYDTVLAKVKVFYA